MKVEPACTWRHFAPGAELHAHDEVEQIYVVEGSFYDQEKTYGAGDYIVRAPGAMHTAGSEGGASRVAVLFPGRLDSIVSDYEPRSLIRDYRNSHKVVMNKA